MYDVKSSYTYTLSHCRTDYIILSHSLSTLSLSHLHTLKLPPLTHIHPLYTYTFFTLKHSHSLAPSAPPASPALLPSSPTHTK